MKWIISRIIFKDDATFLLSGTLEVSCFLDCILSIYLLSGLQNLNWWSLPAAVVKSCILMFHVQFSFIWFLVIIIWFHINILLNFAWQYECLVEGCGLKFKSYKSRQRHLVDKHKFPTSFEFYKKAHLSKKQRQKLQRKQATHKREEDSCMEVDNESIDSLISGISKLGTSDSPSSVSFGRRHTRGLTFVPRAVQREKMPDPTSAGTKR